MVGAFRVAENVLVKLIFGGEEVKKAKGGIGAKRGRGPKGMDRQASQARMRQSIKHARASLAKKKKITVASLFKTSLSALMVQLNSAAPHFVRTVKPNTRKEAAFFDPELVTKQLRYGTTQTIPSHAIQRLARLLGTLLAICRPPSQTPC